MIAAQRWASAAALRVGRTKPRKPICLKASSASRQRRQPLSAAINHAASGIPSPEKPECA